MANLSPIMTLFREFEDKYKQSCDGAVGDDVADDLLDECSSFEKRIMAIPATTAQDLAAKLVVNTRYGDFVPADVGAGGLLDEALALLAVREHPDAELLKLAAEREDQDFDVCLLNELADEINRLSSTDSTADLRQLIDAFAAARAAYYAAPEGEGPEWDAFEATEHAVIAHPCRSMEEVSMKARFFLDNDGPNDTLRNCFSEQGNTLDVFLRSLTPASASA